MDHEALRARFEAVDADRNGRIDEREFAALLEALAVGYTPEQTLIAFQAIDVNGNGTIEFGEFAQWWQE
jgi:Ca2+-binding EF-hand superfamily protein